MLVGAVGVELGTKPVEGVQQQLSIGLVQRRRLPGPLEDVTDLIELDLERRHLTRIGFQGFVDAEQRLAQFRWVNSHGVVVGSILPEGHIEAGEVMHLLGQPGRRSNHGRLLPDQVPGNSQLEAQQSVMPGPDLGHDRRRRCPHHHVVRVSQRDGTFNDQAELTANRNCRFLGTHCSIVPFHPGEHSPDAFRSPTRDQPSW